MATGSRPRAGVDDVILVPVSPSHRRRTRVLLTVTALVAVIVANSAPLNIAVTGIAVLGIFGILALRGTDTE